MTSFSTPLRHPGSNRQALLVCQDDWLDGRAVSLRGRRYALVAASERLKPIERTAARRWIDAGASYVCAWGASAQSTETAFDVASFDEACGPPLNFTLMTTSHARENLEDALWFAFYNALSPGELNELMDTVVIVVDKPSLAQTCENWIRCNRE